MPSTPTVSIGLPVFNGERYLHKAIGDLLSQTFQDFELIISDNASTDATEAICRQAAERDERVRYFRNPTNIGALPNANKTIKLARGEYFCLAAHDDRHAPNYLERLIPALDESPDAVLAYGSCTFIDEDGIPLLKEDRSAHHRLPDGRTVDYDQKLENVLPDDMVRRYHAVLQSNDLNAAIHGLFRRRTLERIGGHQFNGSDRLIVAHAALLGSFEFINEPLFSFRVHAQSTLFLSRKEWMTRETGGTQKASAFATLRTLRNYSRAINASELAVTDRLRAYAATASYALRPAAIRRALVPGLDNYFGIKKWPWKNTDQQEWRYQSTSSPNAANTYEHV